MMPPVHPAAEKFPMMTSEELAALAADIKENGQRVPIQMIDGAILDGRNRWRACEIAGIAPVTQNWNGTGSPSHYVLSINLRRRHLTPEQRAAIAVEFAEMFRQEARIRMEAGKANPTPETSGGSRRDREALAQAAKAAGASLDSAQQIKAAAKVDPELLDMAKAGQVRVAEATRLAKLPALEREEAKAAIKKKGKAPVTRAPKPRTQPTPEKTPEERILSDAMREALQMEHEKRVGTYYFSLDREARLARTFLSALFRRWPTEHRATLINILKESQP